MEIERARTLLGIESNATEEEIKRAYRVAARAAHPDVGGDHQQFLSIKEAFDALKRTGVGKANALPETLEDGTPLSELGKGYPLTESACTCDNCKGCGYQQFRETQNCYRCIGCGLVTLRSVEPPPCPKCEGTGVHRVDGRMIGRCYLCNGQRTVKPKETRSGRYGMASSWFIREPCCACPDCNGTGRTLKETWIRIRCDKCKGIGEINFSTR